MNLQPVPPHRNRRKAEGECPRVPAFAELVQALKLKCRSYPTLDLLAVATRPRLSYDVPIPAARPTHGRIRRQVSQGPREERTLA
jgi:hypothetical protein